MRKVMYFLPVVLLAALLQAQEAETFKVDFDGNLYGTQGLTQDGFQSYDADHEVIATFGPREYTAFGKTITLEPTWADGAPNTAMQALTRRFFGEFPYEFTGAEVALIEDWIGTDTRVVPGDPLTLTISGLPAGAYSWLSYHNDLENQTGVFEVTINDANGSVTMTGFTINNNAVTLDAVAKCVIENIVSNGVDPVVLEFHLTTGTFFLMNGFELTQLSGAAAALSPNPENNAIVDLTTISSLSWEGASDPNIVSIDQFDLVFGTEPNMPQNTVYENVTSPFVFADHGIYLDYATGYYWRIDSHITWDSAEITGSIQDIAVGSPWYFETLPENKVPTVATDANKMDALTSMEFLPADLTGAVNDFGEGDIAAVTWEVIGTNAPAVAMQLITRNSETALTNLAAITPDPNLLMDWIGTDIRDEEEKPLGNPMLLTLKGLPADTYSWKSYHHDPDATVTGMFDVTIFDASGSSPATSTDIKISNSNQTPVTAFETTITSNGSDDVILVFDLHPYTAALNEAWFVMNGFELTSEVGSLLIDFNNVDGPLMPGYQAYEAQHEVPDTFTEQNYSAFNTTVSILPTWGGMATVTDTTNDPSSPTQSAILSTDWPGSYIVRLTVTDNVWTSSDTMTVRVAANACVAAQEAPGWTEFNYYDVDEDCDVDLADFAALALQWLDNRNANGQIQVYP